jgi:hypothetical protein
MVFLFYLPNYFWPPKITGNPKASTGVIRTFIGSDIYDMRKQKKIQIYLYSLWIPCHHGMAHPQVAGGKDCSELWR